MTRRLLLISALLVLLPGLAAAQTERFALQSDLDHVWTMTAAALVFFMQGGFLLLEAGSVRSKNSINVAQKNLLDFFISVACFSFIGFALMFGNSVNGWWGFDRDFAFFNMGGEDWPTTFFVFQMVFCGTAATIVSGAVAERASMRGYVIAIMLIGLCIYPIAGHWAWGGLLTGSEQPWLAAMGFMDFAGSTVVHSVGAWVGLAYCILIGPRHGRFSPTGKPVTLHGHSQVLATFGAIVIFVGWIGFNGGSTLIGSGAFSTIIANTFLAAAAGGLTMAVIGYFRTGVQRPENLINGSLAGLVGITAGCDVLTGPASVLVGISAAWVYDRFRRILFGRFSVDDPVGAISVHGAAGAWGTLVLAVLAPSDSLLAATRLEQIGVQLIGIAAFFVWAFGITFVVLKLAARFLGDRSGPGGGLRVDEEAEILGLNVSEHQAPLGLTTLVDGMQAVLSNPAAEIEPIKMDYGEDGYEIAVLFNKIADRIRESHNRERAETQKSLDLLESISSAIRDIQNGNLSVRVLQQEDGPLAELANQLNGVFASIEDLVKDVGKSTEVVASTARNLLQKSGTLSEETEEQSRQLDRLTGEMSILQMETRETSDQIKAAVENVVSIRRVVTDGANDFRAAFESMLQATKATDRIFKALEEIDTIAFETRLLSLNASVEAARAKGDDMAGFAVIANEVRNLAEAAGKTATNIRGIVEEVQIESQQAADRAKSTEATFTSVSDGIDACAQTMVEVGAAQDRTTGAVEAVETELTAMQTRVRDVASHVDATREAAKGLSDTTDQSEAFLARFRATPERKAA